MSALLPFVMAGDPSLGDLPAHLSALRAAGIEAVEIGIPHSDPIADGPILQEAAQRAIARGVTLRGVLEALAGVEDSPDLILFSYFNPLLQLGEETLLGLLRPTLVTSLLIVDLPFGEEPAFEARMRDGGYPVVPLLGPTTSIERAKQVLWERPDPGEGAPFAQRFAYVVARLGITGEGTTALAPVAERVAALRAITTRPLAVGFGLSGADVFATVRAMGATPVVGSALVKALAAGAAMPQALASVGLEAPTPDRARW